MSDPFEKLTTHLRQLAKDSNRIARGVIGVLTAAKQLDNTSFQAQLDRTLGEIENLTREWVILSNQIEALKGQAGVIRDGEIIALAEKAADVAMIGQQVGETWRLAYIDLAHRILSADKDLFPYTVQEVHSYPKGDNQLKALSLSIQEVLPNGGNTNSN